jgi:hypothetical protein
MGLHPFTEENCNMNNAISYIIICFLLHEAISCVWNMTLSLPCLKDWRRSSTPTVVATANETLGCAIGNDDKTIWQHHRVSTVARPRHYLLLPCIVPCRAVYRSLVQLDAHSNVAGRLIAETPVSHGVTSSDGTETPKHHQLRVVVVLGLEHEEYIA